MAGSVPDQTIVTGNGVTIIGAGNLAASVPGASSAFLARNFSALLLHMVADGALAIDPADEIQAGVVITHDGAVIQPATAALLAEASPGAENPGAGNPSAGNPGAVSPGPAHPSADTSGGTTP